MDCSSFLIACALAADPQTVVVQLDDGRTILGVLDGPTDEATLWLRSEQGAVTVRSGFSRDRVRLIERVHPADLGSLQPEAEPTALPLPPLPLDATSVLDHAVPSHKLLPATNRVQSLEVFGHAASWDRDIEIDGVRVVVRPLDPTGRVVPIDGQIDLILYGQDIRRSNVLDLQPPPFPELGRISRRVRKSDFREDGVLVELPYSRRNPEFDLHIFPEGLLSARLGVPGQGVFDAADAWVFLRPPSVIRDQLEFQTGRRFLPTERALPGTSLPTFPVPNRHNDRLAR
ncbi:MAG: hypothetical protein SH850_09135 [Planctomycetaceae bacterium]|nr:hypothetical protein [Planctomycetaceae bacterium]